MKTAKMKPKYVKYKHPRDGDKIQRNKKVDKQ